MAVVLVKWLKLLGEPTNFLPRLEIFSPFSSDKVVSKLVLRIVTGGLRVVVKGPGVVVDLAGFALTNGLLVVLHLPAK